MSEAAQSALVNAKSSKQGTPTGAHGSARQELSDLGIIGKDGGLTRKGSIVREALIEVRLDAAFG